MKTYQQQTASILKKARKRKMQRKAALIGGCTALGGAAATALALVLFLPYPTVIPSVAGYADSEYFPVIETLAKMTYEGPRYKNNFEKWTSSLFPSGGDTFDAAPVIPEDTGVDVGWDESVDTPDGVGPNGSTGSNGNGDYVETTDNQVDGVIEADLLKRTENYAYQLLPYATVRLTEERGSINENALLRVFSIDGENSTLVDEVAIIQGDYFEYSTLGEMYLSLDGTTLTVITTCVGQSNEKYTTLTSLDVRDPRNVTQINQVYFSGAYLSSRLVDGTLLLINSHSLTDIDFDDEKTFLPQYGTLGNMQNVAAENVFCASNPTQTTYTVVNKLDAKTLEVQDSAALLSYTDAITVSKANVFLSEEYSQQTTREDGKLERLTKTEIACVNYVGEGLELKGSVEVNGSIKDQYSMDEYENVLRVATTHRWRLFEERTNVYATYQHRWWATVERQTNANLYCIDLNDFTFLGKVECFAPENESVESVRFDGVNAYVCTAEVILLTDPVFFFDLSDPKNPTYTDTGTIDGYSSSLIDFGHGYLVGIGFGENGESKVEVYTQGEGKVDSVCSYLYEYPFATSYKAYLIDRENGLVGIPTWGWIDGKHSTPYLLLKFENETLTGQTIDIKTSSLLAQNVRAFYEDGYLYIFADTLTVEYVG